MKKIINILIISVIAFCLGFTIKQQEPKINALLKLEQLGLNEKYFSTPTWTRYLRAYVNLQKAINDLESFEKPYNVNMTINGNPTSRMGFAWFTNFGVTGGKLQIVEGKHASHSSFAKPTNTVYATSTSIPNMNYNAERNELLSLTGIPDNSKRSYQSNKSLASGLKANTTYSFRVGKEGAWSNIGTFTTAKTGKDDFSFIYVADTQARTDENFDVSRKTVQTARKMFHDVNFLLCAGDFVDSGGSENSEWEWEQWFETMQNVWYTTPIVPVQGNHDASPNSNLFYHFNTDTAFNQNRAADSRLTMNGTVYSFVYGDALFLVINYEDFKKGEPFFKAIEEWMTQQIKANTHIKWKIVTQHRNMYTGANHQDSSDGKLLRERMTPVYDRLNIDLVIQGHDHVYQVMGPLYNHQLVKSGISGVIEEKPETPRENMSGKRGGIFNVQKGTLYFVNNSGGRKKYDPRTEKTMNEAVDKHGVSNYFSLFTGKFGQTGEPTFSNVEVSSAQIKITTYTVNYENKTNEFDSFVIVK